MRRETWLWTARARTPRSARRTEVFCKSVLWEAPRMSATILVVDDDPVTLTLVERTPEGGRIPRLDREQRGGGEAAAAGSGGGGGPGPHGHRHARRPWHRPGAPDRHDPALGACPAHDQLLREEDLESQGLEVPEAHLLRKPFAPLPSTLRRRDRARRERDLDGARLVLGVQSQAAPGAAVVARRDVVGRRPRSGNGDLEARWSPWCPVS